MQPAASQRPILETNRHSVRSAREIRLAFLRFLAHSFREDRPDNSRRHTRARTTRLAQRDRAGHPLRQERRGVVRDGERGRGASASFGSAGAGTSSIPVSAAAARGAAAAAPSGNVAAPLSPIDVRQARAICAASDGEAGQLPRQLGIADTSWAADAMNGRGNRQRAGASLRPPGAEAAGDPVLAGLRLRIASIQAEIADREPALRLRQGRGQLSAAWMASKRSWPARSNEAASLGRDRPPSTGRTCCDPGARSMAWRSRRKAVAPSRPR